MPRPRSPQPATRRPVLLAAGLILAVAGAAVLWNRIALVQRGATQVDVPSGVTRDPASRARGAVLTISGQQSDPRATYDPAAGTVWVRFQSRYFDPKHAPAYNREYLATEGRLVVQLVLYNVPQVSQAVAELYRGGQLLATVTGGQGDAYAAYKVEYARGLP